MCGINGVFAYGAGAAAPSERELIATRDHMAARGLDGAGIWWSPNRRLGLGHRRLSIVDLSARVGQQMISLDGRHIVVVNGEIYNYQTLRADLEVQCRVFRTSYDTEALLNLFALHGPALAKMLRGMFAFAICDTDRGGPDALGDGTLVSCVSRNAHVETLFAEL
jgi:asparagine synthase (glutamine-hydrolysing)